MLYDTWLLEPGWPLQYKAAFSELIYNFGTSVALVTEIPHHMKKVLFFGPSGPFLVLFLVATSFHAWGQVYFEDFTGEADGATSGTAAGTVGGTWSVTTLPTGGAASFSRFDAGFPLGPLFLINQTGNEGIWQSNDINISALGEIAFDVTLMGNAATAADYVQAFYKLDGGPEIKFGEVFGSPGLTIATRASAIVSGNTVQIVIRGMDNSGGAISAMAFDNVTGAEITVLYSIADNNWNNGNTWSTGGFAGPACGCIPSANTRVVIGNGRTVNFNVNGTAAGVEVQSTGRLLWTVNNLALTMARGEPLNIQTGGTLSRNTMTGSSIIFNGYDYNATVDGSVDINTLDFNAGSSFTVGGGGTLLAGTVIVGMGSGKVMTNNITGAGASFTVTGDLSFEAGAPSSFFVNNGALDAGRIIFDDNNVSFTNNGTLVSTTTGLRVNSSTDDGNSLTNNGTFSVSAIDLNSGNFTLNNSGTITQTGDFTTVDAGSSFINLSGSTWNFSGTAITNVRLFANNNSNTFNYNRAGTQNIITPQDAYSNITLSGSGAKVAGGDFSVNGNWRRSPATATFSNGGFRVTFSGNIPQTIIAAAGETFANMTINNSSPTSPQITLNNGVAVSGNLTMLDGNVNLGGNLFNISSSAATALTHDMTAAAGWMYGGSLRRAIPATGIVTETVAGYFPLGGASNSRPFFFGKSNTASSNGTITIVYNDASTVTDITFTDGAAVIQRRHDSYWAITKAGITAGTFDITGGGTGFTIANVNQTRLTRASDALAIGTAAASGGTPADVRVRRTGLLSAQIVNNFYVASTDKVNSPLPIELSYFHARVQGDEVVTTWKTLQEKDNHYFTVEKTVDFETFYEAGRIDGRGNSVQERSYSLVDDAPFTGRSYYRLKQTDFNGKFTVSDPVTIDYRGPSPVLKAYPNPFNGRNITLEVKGVSEVANVKVFLFTQQGQKILEISIDEDGPGIFKKEIIFPDNLAPGLYFLKAGKTLQLTSKVIVY